jgi:hypothetical protein
MDESKHPKSKEHSLRALNPDRADLKELSVEELKALKEAILARAAERVGPEGFNPILQDTTGGSSTEDFVFDPAEWYILVASIVRAILVVSVAIVASVSWVATASVLSGPNAERYGGLSIGVSILFSAVFLVAFTAVIARPALGRGRAAGS